MFASEICIASQPFAAPVDLKTMHSPNLLNGSAMRGFKCKPLTLLMLGLGMVSSVNGMAQSIAGNAGEPMQVQIEGKKSRVATKTDTRLEDVPQAIQVIETKDALEKGSTALQEALRYSAAVTAEPYGPDSRYDNIFVRGLEAVQTLDGMRRIFTFSPLPRIDLMAIDRVEVLKGPASVVYGQANSGGAVNAVSKLPKWKNALHMYAQAGSYDLKHIALDAQYADESKVWAMRMVGLLRHAGTFVPQIKDNRELVMPSLVFRPAEGTQLSLQLLHQKDKGASTQQFLPIAAAMPHLFGDSRRPIASNTYVGDVHFDKLIAEQNMATLAWQQSLSDHWELNTQLRKTNAQTDLAMLYPDNYTNPSNPFTDPARRIVNRLFYAIRPDIRTLSADVNVVGKMMTGSVRHQILIGADQHRYTENNQMAYGLSTPLDLDNPVSSGVQPAVLSQQPTQTSRQTGWYLQDQLELSPQWLAIAGVRSDSSKTTDEGSPEVTASAVSKRLGLMYRAGSGVQPYLNYSESFMPVLGRDFYGKSFVPVKGRQFELGAKYQFAQSSYLNVAAFKINEKNRQTNDPGNPNNVLQVGEVRSQGLELEYMSKLSNKSYLQLNASLIDAKTIRSTIAQDVGKRLVDVPRVQANLWLARQFSLAGQQLDGGLGVRYVGSTESHNLTRTFTTPGYTLLDARLGMQAGKFNLNLTVTNLLNKHHFLACRAIGDCFAGTDRKIILDTQWAF